MALRDQIMKISVQNYKGMNFTDNICTGKMLDLSPLSQQATKIYTMFIPGNIHNNMIKLFSFIKISNRIQSLTL